jgi:hypothetical protein
MSNIQAILEGFGHFSAGISLVAVDFYRYLVPKNPYHPTTIRSGSVKKPVCRLTAADMEAFRKDRAALASDWKFVGNDLRNAIDTYVETH